MEAASPILNWKDDSSVLLYGPTLSAAEKQQLESLYRQFDRPGHLFVPSSGSSSSPQFSLKLIAISKAAFLSSAAAVNQHLSVNVSDKWLLALPRYHVGGLSILARAFLAGNPVVEFADKWSASSFTNAVVDHEITLTSLVPTQIFDLVRPGIRAPTCLRAIVVGGAALSEELYFQARKLGWPVLPSFGMTECSSQIATAELNSLNANAYPSLKVLSHVQAELMDGLLKIRGSSLLAGYAQIQNGKAVWVEPLVDGWLQTEDMAELTAEYLRPLGRSSDFVKIMGEGISLELLRQKLSQVFNQQMPKDIDPALANEVVLVAYKSPREGSQVAMVTSSKIPERAAKGLFASYNQQARGIERSQGLFRVEKLPRSSLGKLLSAELQAGLASGRIPSL